MFGPDRLGEAADGEPSGDGIDTCVDLLETMVRHRLPAGSSHSTPSG